MALDADGATAAEGQRWIAFLGIDRRGQNMVIIVSILLGSLFFGGLVRLLIFLRGRADLLPKSERVLGKERHLALAIINISFSGFGFFLLFSKTFEPMDILIGVSIVGLLFEVGFRKGSVNWAG